MVNHPIHSPLKYLSFLSMAAGNQPPATAIAQKLKASGSSYLRCVLVGGSLFRAAAGLETVVYPISDELLMQ